MRNRQVSFGTHSALRNVHLRNSLHIGTLSLRVRAYLLNLDVSRGDISCVVESRDVKGDFSFSWVTQHEAEVIVRVASFAPVHLDISGSAPRICRNSSTTKGPLRAHWERLPYSSRLRYIANNFRERKVWWVRKGSGARVFTYDHINWKYVTGGPV